MRNNFRSDSVGPQHRRASQWCKCRTVYVARCTPDLVFNMHGNAETAHPFSTCVYASSWATLAVHTTRKQALHLPTTCSRCTLL